LADRCICGNSLHLSSLISEATLVKANTLLISLLSSFIVFLFVGPNIAYSDTQTDMKKMTRAFSKFKEASYTLTLRHRVRGALRPAEVVEVKCTKAGAVFAKWTGKRHRNRTILYNPGWNNNQAWIMEGGALSFAAVSIPVDDKIIKKDYRLGIEFLGVGKILEVLKNTKVGNIALTLNARGLPVKIVVKDDKDRILEQFEFANFKFNPRFAANQFDPLNPSLGFPGYSTDGIVIDAAQFQSTLLGNYAKMKDYTCVMHKQERIKGKLQPFMNMYTKFRKPGDIYMKWLPGPKEGREILFRQGHYNDKVIAHDGGFADFITVKLDPNGSMVKGDTNHDIAETDLGHTARTIVQNLHRGLVNNEIKLQFNGLQRVGGKDVYVVESWTVKGKGYYSYHSINAHDVETGLPIRTVNYDENDQLFESFEWRDFTPNVGLTDADFDRDNPEYKF